LGSYGVPQRDPGWIYAVRAEADVIKIGMTTDPKRRLLREASTWSPRELEIVAVKPFWNIRRAERTLHTALAEHWIRGEWHKFQDPYWLNFFVDGICHFDDDDRDLNSVNFIYWMNSTNFAELVRDRIAHKMTLSKWRECRGDPWHLTRADILRRMQTT
jgi:hypothetical protein